MLSRPRNGWTLFKIGESKEYPLSDVFDDIAFGLIRLGLHLDGVRSCPVDIGSEIAHGA